VDEVLDKIFNFQDIMDKLIQDIPLTKDEEKINDLQLLLGNIESILAYIKISSLKKFDIKDFDRNASLVQERFKIPSTSTNDQHNLKNRNKGK
jgi:dsDNA-binding SOS-regulon protein